MWAGTKCTLNKPLGTCTLDLVNWEMSANDASIRVSVFVPSSRLSTHRSLSCHARCEPAWKLFACSLRVLSERTWLPNMNLGQCGKLLGQPVNLLEPIKNSQFLLLNFSKRRSEVCLSSFFSTWTGCWENPMRPCGKSISSGRKQKMTQNDKLGPTAMSNSESETSNHFGFGTKGGHWGNCQFYGFTNGCSFVIISVWCERGKRRSKL